jgi:hypothetical protein
MFFIQKGHTNEHMTHSSEQNKHFEQTNSKHSPSQMDLKTRLVILKSEPHVRNI